MGKWVHGEVSALFSACTLFVLPSRDEPFGLVILEAAYYKKGIVCTRVGGVPEIIADGVNGLLVAPDNPEEMAAAILRLHHDHELAARLGACAHETLMRRFLWKDRVGDYLALFDQPDRDARGVLTTGSSDSAKRASTIGTR